METLRIGSTGTKVKLIQSLLIRIGYDPGRVDGIYGPITQAAVMAFQKDSGVSADGVVGPVTWALFNRILKGYEDYTILPGDTLYGLALKYGTSVEKIIAANPGIDPLNLQVGQNVKIPFGVDVVFTDIDYTYEIMEKNLRALKERYPFLQVGVFAKSVLGKNLYYIKLGEGNTKVHYNASHHALEWITTPLVMKFVENFAKAFVSGQRLRGYSVQEIYESSSIYVVPMLNPDGVDLVLEGLKPDNPYYAQLLSWNQTGLPFSRVWQANIRGVDLNRNYPASWAEAKAQEPMLGVTGPGPTRFGGVAPLSEPESLGLVEFTRTHGFDLVLSYHSQGRVIYWKYKDRMPQGSFEIAQQFSRVSGYLVADVPYEAAYAGYKDYFIEAYNKPGYTIEVGMGRNPLPIEQFGTIYNENEEIMLLAPILAGAIS
jgi:g-D-glutamyl-meso-diaminopimelate peptidase